MTPPGRQPDEWKARHLQITQSERDHGMIVTVTDGLDMRSFVAHGMPTEAIQETIRQVDDMDGDWKIVSICTPKSIYRDLQGTRAQLVVRGSRFVQEGKRRDGTERTAFGDPRSTEIALLSKAHRMDLLKPLPKDGSTLPHGTNGVRAVGAGERGGDRWLP